MLISMHYSFQITYILINYMFIWKVNSNSYFQSFVRKDIFDDVASSLFQSSLGCVFLLLFISGIAFVILLNTICSTDIYIAVGCNVLCVFRNIVYVRSISHIGENIYDALNVILTDLKGRYAPIPDIKPKYFEQNERLYWDSNNFSCCSFRQEFMHMSSVVGFKITLMKNCLLR